MGSDPTDPTCRWCGRTRSAGAICHNTREMEDSGEGICFAALMFHGGGEMTEARRLAEQLRMIARDHGHV